MPVHLPAQNRRQFLFTLGAGFLTCSAGVFAKDSQQSDIIYLLNDTHIGEKHPENSPVPSHLRKVVSELVSLEQKPACVLIPGAAGWSARRLPPFRKTDSPPAESKNRYAPDSGQS